MVEIHYKIITSKYDPPTSSYQCRYFSSMIKNKTDGYVYVTLQKNEYWFDDSDDFLDYEEYIDSYDLKDKVSKAAGIPINTIVDIYFYSKIYVDEYKNYTKPNYHNTLFYVYPTFYVYVDLSKDPVFNNINNAQLNSESEKKNFEKQIKNLNSTVNNLNNQNWESKQKLNNIINKNKQMSSKNEELEKDIQNLKNKYNNLQSNSTQQISNLNQENINLKRRFEEEKNQMNERNKKLERNISSLEDRNKDMKF